jgi:hypothetical protein
MLASESARLDEGLGPKVKNLEAMRASERRDAMRRWCGVAGHTPA